MAIESNKQLVFLVEDDRFYLELLENYFSEKDHFKVLPFLTGEECIANLNLNPDLVILDYFLDRHNPNAMDGKIVYRKIVEQCPNARIVVVSAQQSTEVVFGLVKEGVKDYVMKGKETFEQLDLLLAQNTY